MDTSVLWVEWIGEECTNMLKKGDECVRLEVAGSIPCGREVRVARWVLPELKFVIFGQ